MSLQGAAQLARCRIPEADAAILARRDDHLAVAGEDQGVNRTAMTSQHRLFLAGLCVPQAYLALLSRRGERLSGWRKGHGKDRPAMSAQGAQRTAGSIPEADVMIRAARRQHVS